jgi:hypothetical protein
MMNRRTGLAAVVAVLVAATYAFFFRQSDEGRIRRQLAALAAAARVEEGPANPVFRAAHLKEAFSGIFTKRVEVDVAEYARDTLAPEDLVGATIAVEAPLQAASLDFSSVRVEIADPPASARVTGTATGVGVEGGGGRRVEKRDFVMRFEKVDGTWRIASVSTLAAP